MNTTQPPFAPGMFSRAWAVAMAAATALLGAASLQAQTTPNIQLTPGVDYTVGNYAYSPPLTKFSAKLPGLFSQNSNELGQYIPVAKPNTPYGTPYPGSDYYEIGLVEYVEQLHKDLPATGTKLRGYVQVVPSSYQGAVPLDTAHGLSKNITDSQGNLLYGADKPHYAGPMIISFKGVPVRVKFMNLLPTGAAGRHFIPVDTSIPGAGDGPVQMGVDPATGLPVYEQYTQNRANIHLHGGFPPWNSDGTPHQWIAPLGEQTSYKRGADALNVPDMPDPGEGAMTYYWPNLQSGRLLWYHDHTYGLTGPNVYAGEIAPYLLLEPEEETALAAAGVPGTLAAGPGATNDFDHLITMVLQDKTFVPDAATVQAQDPNWLTDITDGMTGAAPAMGSLWSPHVYVPNQWPDNPDGSGANGLGRWDYGPWFWPPWIVNVPYPPKVSHTPESFQDTPVVNGQPYPYVDVQPAKYRIKILNGADDRYWNLQMYVASSIISNIVVLNGGSGYDPLAPPYVHITGGGGRGATASALVDATGVVTGISLDITGSGFSSPPTVTIDPPVAPGGTQATAEAQIYTDKTEVGLVQASASAGISFPAVWRTQTPGYTPDILDGRPGGIPDPATRGPAFVKIANECGILPNPVVFPNIPVGFEQNKKNIVVLNVKEHTLWLAPAERADVVVDFSKFAGKTILLYNDAPAALPAADARNDLYACDADQTGAGGPASTLPGMGPNTRTVMQFRVAAAPVPAPPGVDSSAPADYYDPALVAALADSATGMPAIFGATQPTPVVPEAAYNSVGYAGGSTANTYAKIQDTSMTFIPYGQSTPVTMTFKPKCIQELFDDTGRLNATLGTEVPFANQATQTTVPLYYVDPITEVFNDGETQIWKLTHNGVDSHCVHFHLVNVQVINRVGWDGQVVPPEDDEVGWKETVRMHPLQDIIFATRAVSVPVPFGVMDSVRYLNPSQPPGSPIGFSNWDPLTGNNLATPTTNVLSNFNWAYIWHCHLLGHEENDMMRPMSLVVDSLVPAAPSLVVKASQTGPATGSVALTWTDGTPFDYATGLPATTPGNPANEVGFRVERAVPAVSATRFVAIGNIPANVTNFVDVTAGYPSTNVYRVVAFNAKGEASSVNTTVKLVPDNGPGAPTGLAASVTSLNPATVTLSWVNAAGPVAATSTRVQRAPAGSTSFVTIATLAPGLATYSDTTVSFNAGYSYRLVAVGTYGSSTSVPASVTVQPGAPTSLTAVSPMSTLANLAVNLSWTGHPAGQDNFLVYRATGSGTATLIATLGPAVTSYSDVTVAEGGTYTYTVIARNAAGNSLPSNAATVTAASRPAAPGGLTAQPATRTRISLAWVNNANNQASFRIERAVGSGPFTALTTLASTVSAGTLLAYTDTPVLNNGTIYSYRVFAVNLMGDSPASGVAQAATATTAPPAPTVVTASGRQVTATATSVTVTWTEPATGLTNLPTSYDIQRRTGSAGAATWTTLATVPSTGGLTYTDTTATFGSAYGYRIRASNAAGNSAYFPGTTAGQQVVWTPGAPASLSATVSNGIVTLSWPAVTSSHTGYRVERSAAGGAFAALATVTSTVTTGNISATDTTAAAGIGYTYRVFAVNAVGDSLASPTATATVPTLPGAPTGLTATQRTNPLGVVLTWVNNATNATAFEVQRATGAAGTFTTLATVAGANITTYTDGTAAINVAGGYRYQVRAINAGGSSAFSPVVSITPAIAHVQSVVSTAVASASAVTTPALGAAQAAGNLNIVVVSWKDTTRSVTNVVDSRGVTYAQAGTTTSGTGLRQAVYYAVAQAGSSTTVTARFNGAATSPEVRFLEYSGVSALDQFAGASGTNANANSGNTAATTAANELVFGACFSSNATTVGTGFTARVTTSTGLAEEKTVTATGAQSATASVAAGTGRAWVIQAVTFK